MIGVIARNDLRRRLAQPLSIATWVGIPTMIALLMASMGLAGGDAGPIVTVLLVDPEASISGQILRAAAGRRHGLVIEPANEAEARGRLDDGRATAILFLPPDIDRAILDASPATLDLLLHPGQQVLPGIVTELTETALDAAWYGRRLLAEPVDAMRGREAIGLGDLAAAMPKVQQLMEDHLPPPLRLEVETAGGAPARVRFGTAVVPGFLIMALLFTAAGLADDLWAEREAGTLARFLIGPRSIWTYLLGKLTAAAVLMTVLSAAGLAAGIAVAERGLAGAPVALAALVLMGVVFVALYMTIQMLAASRRTGAVLTTVIMFPLLMVGGSFFPLDQLPGTIGALARWTPNGRVVSLVEAALLGRLDLQEAAWVAGLLALLGAAAFLFLGRRLKRVAKGA